jgi:allantoate deiminase
MRSEAADLAKSVVQRINELGTISEEKGRLTRTFCSPAMRQANALVAGWMREAGMRVRQDAIGNLIGRYVAAEAHSGNEKPKVLLLGSHLDTVRDAGKFDGPLGVLVAIACVGHLNRTRTRLPFDVEVVGFADEEGVRYQTTYLGSKALAGTFSARDLKLTDAKGIKMRQAIQEFGGEPENLRSAKLDHRKLLGYVEVHIEQGPVLERQSRPLGVVSAIAGQSRANVRFIGRAGHAGTTPMHLRQDALCAAAEFMTAVEMGCPKHLVATVGEIQALPGASNVIPGEVKLTLDVRHANDSIRRTAMAGFLKAAQGIAKHRKLKCEATVVHEAAAVHCDQKLTALLGESVRAYQRELISLPSGAGHDAAVMATITPVAMLFVRCKGGISHHPDEYASPRDIAVALEVLIHFTCNLAGKDGSEFEWQLVKP